MPLTDVDGRISVAPIGSSAGDPERQYLQNVSEWSFSASQNSVILGEQAHGFSILDAVGWDGSNWVQAQASLAGTEALGIVVNTQNANVFQLAVNGLWLLPAHGLSVGKNYLDPTTAGGLTTTEPGPGQRVQYVAFVFDANAFLVNPIGESLP